MAQGFLEESNVDAIGQITRMIAVQRAYELGQGLLDREDSRIRNVIQTVTR
jgi:flagellar basal-body rod protein FlgF